MENSNNAQPLENSEEFQIQNSETENEFEEPLVRKKWEVNLILFCFAIAVMALLYFLNYVFGFMKGN
jgi:hypothetical protein